MSDNDVNDESVGRLTVLSDTNRNNCYDINIGRMYK